MLKNNLHFALIILGSLMLAACSGELHIESNEGPVFAVSSDTISVPEDIIGIIYDANATDADDDTIIYSISGGADSIHFSIGNSSGELRFQSPPDYGNPSDSDGDNIYEIELSVSDGIISVSMQLTVIVRSINQAPNASISVSPDPEITILTTDTEITLDGSASSDPDGDTIAYTWSQEQNINLSSEDGPSTRFTATAAGTYTFTLTVSDGEKSDSSTLVLDIFPVSVAPGFTSPDTARANENYSGVIYTATATDADADDTLSYSIVGGADRKLFSLSGAELSFVNAANYENAEDSDGDNIYEVLLRVTDSYDLYADLSLSISVADVNEAPTFTSSAAVSVDENYSGVIYSATADDVDAGDTMNYSIAGGVDQSFFSLEGAELSFTEATRVGADSDGDSIYQVQLRVTDAKGLYDELNLSVSVDDVNEAPIFTSPDTASADENYQGVIYTATADDDDDLTYSIIGGADRTVFNLSVDELSLIADLDYENPVDSNGDNTYELILRATDSGGLYADLNLSVSVADVNEAPTFTSSATVSVDENYSGVIYSATADDVDAGDTMNYSIAGGVDQSFFSLEGAELSFTEATRVGADSDGDSIYQVQLRVTDAKGLYDELNLSVSVDDVNEAPIFTSPDTASADENYQGVIYTAAANDIDAGDTITYSIIGGADRTLFVLSADELNLSTDLDYENPIDSDGDNTYELILRATDSGGLYADLNLSVSISDVNEAPILTSSTTVSVDENHSGVIYTAAANDVDAGDTLVYDIVGGDDRLAFSLAGADLSFTELPNYESPVDSDGDNIYEVILQVTDSGELRADLNLSVSIADVNEAPTFTSLAAVNIDENYLGVLYNAEAYDSDAGDTISYSIVGGADRSFFSLDGAELSVTGAIRVGADSDGDSIYQVQLRVTDAKGLYDELNLSVSVADVNEAPIFTSPAAVSVDENQSGVIYTAAANDVDAGDTLTYSIIGGADRAVFILSADELNFTADLDYENPIDSDGDNTYEVILRATDSGGLYADLNLSVGIADVNEAPIFTSPATASVDENQSGVIYTAVADDVDAGDTLTYSIIGGADRAVFILSADELNLSTDLDYENPIDSDGDNTYEVILRATDSGGLYADLNLSVSVVDVNQAPIFTSPAEVSVDENYQGVIYTAAARDIDIDDVLEYSIVGGVDQLVFSLSGADLSLIGPPDYESPADSDSDNTYEVILRVTDLGGLYADLNFSVTVVNINEAPNADIIIGGFDSETTIPTIETRVALIGYNSSDPDGDQLSYTWSQPPDQFIEIDPLISLGGTNYTSTAFTASEHGIYTFTLTVSDGELEDSTETTVTIYPIALSTDFAATATSTQVTLTWIPYSIATTYSIYRSTDPNCDPTVANIATNCLAGAAFNTVSSGFVDIGLTNGITYYYWIEATLDGITQSTADPISTTLPTGILNDTGIYRGVDYSSDKNSDCSSNINAPQDCHHGRDADSSTNDNSDGHAGFSFTKLDSNGNALTANATNWSCVQDNVTGLIWEVKTDDGGIHDKDNKYQWGGITAIGYESPNREGTYYSDWDVLVNGANSNELCGFDDWRVPRREELSSIVDYSRYSASIDLDYFPNTISNAYWSASPYAIHDSGYAWQVSFATGNDLPNGRFGVNYLRLVRAGQ